MSDLNMEVVFGVATVSLVALVITCVFVIRHFIATRLEEVMRSRFRSSQIVKKKILVDCYGMTPDGHGDLRGYGVLVLGKKELWFSRGRSGRSISIPIDSVSSVSLPATFNDEESETPFLSVEFHNDQGESAIAWQIDDREGWKAVIERTKKRAAQRH